MAQHDQAIDNGPGRAVRLDINAALAALFSNNSGVVEPEVTVEGQSWFDISDPDEPRLLIRNVANDGWLNIATDLSPSSYEEAPNSFTLEPSDNGQFFQSTSAITATLPPVEDVDDRWFVMFQAYSGSCTIACQGTDRIDDSPTLVVPIGYWVMVRCTGQGYRTSQIPLTVPKLQTVISQLPIISSLAADDQILLMRNNGTMARVDKDALGSPQGTIIMFGGPTTPAGHLACNGAAVSRTVYPELFAAIGGYYGAGDGSTTFNLPDFRGIFPRGWDNGRGVDPSRTFGSLQGSLFASHAHSVYDPSHYHVVYGGVGTSGQGYTQNGVGSNTLNVNTAYAATGIGIYATGGNETRPINIAVLFAIKY